MSCFQDGPASPKFECLKINGNYTLSAINGSGVSCEMLSAIDQAPSGNCVAWGIPFAVKKVIVIKENPVTEEFKPITPEWLVFMHTSDSQLNDSDTSTQLRSIRGEGQLGEHVANYVILYNDLTECVFPIMRRYQIGMFQRRWGECCFEAVPHQKPHTIFPSSEETATEWGLAQTRVDICPRGNWENWITAWENPYPERPIIGIRFEPKSGTVLISAVSAGSATSLPLRWRRRQKARLSLTQNFPANKKLISQFLLQSIQLDLGQVISAKPQLIYPNNIWENSHNNRLPDISKKEILVEYTSHSDANFHFNDGSTIPVTKVENGASDARIHFVSPSHQPVTLRTIDSASGQTVPVKLHIHGKSGEYLSPVDRHRTVNPKWFEDYSVDFIHRDTHACTYISGETTINLPMGKIYIEVSKGFEIRPIRRVLDISPSTKDINIEIEKALNWREEGWVTADTHVHFLSPSSALLEGAAEGVNIVNLLTSQWGELLTNVGDFDGKTTWGTRESGGDGEHLVRVGSENRQCVLGHISLLGYSGQPITPLTCGGPPESAIGDPVEILLTEWARQCRNQGGIAVLPHFPDPRAEHAASIISGDIDAIEMTSMGDLYGGIDPYSLTDWYRYLNCGYLVPVVGGTDKMRASTPVGAVRTYARIQPNEIFTYDDWMDAIRRKETFVTYGPLLEFKVEGQRMGSQIELPSNGGTVSISWKTKSVTVPISKVELVVNGEIRESVTVSPEEASGTWEMRIDKSSWVALLVRGQYPDKPEMIAAHSSPVMILLEGSQIMADLDAVTILEQIEGSIAFLDTLGIRANEESHKRMLLILKSAHREMHNRLHYFGYYHDHTPLMDHE